MLVIASIRMVLPDEMQTMVIDGGGYVLDYDVFVLRTLSAM